MTCFFLASDRQGDQPSRSIPHETDARTGSEGQNSGSSLYRFPNPGLQRDAWRRLRRRRSLSPPNQPIQLPDQLPLPPAAFLTSLQTIEKSRQVQPIAQLNAQVVEVFAAGQIERGHCRVSWWLLTDESRHTTNSGKKHSLAFHGTPPVVGLWMGWEILTW
jgi:hypothetical protein